LKRLSELQVGDLERYAVWELRAATDLFEPWVIPVEGIPVSNLSNRIVGVRAELHGGTRCWAILGNIHLSNCRATEQFVTVSIERSGNWFDLARYHDVDYSRRGPLQLAAFLELSLDEVFPVAYDISRVAAGIPEVTKGVIPAKPREFLGQSELIELALE